MIIVQHCILLFYRYQVNHHVLFIILELNNTHTVLEHYACANPTILLLSISLCYQMPIIHVRMGICDWPMARLQMKVDLKCASSITGAPCVMTILEISRPSLSAESLGSLKKVHVCLKGLRLSRVTILYIHSCMRTTNETIPHLSYTSLVSQARPLH